MSISFLTQTITRVRPVYTTERGDQVADWTNATTTDLTGWRLQPLVGEELLGLRDAVTRRWKAFGPPGVDVTELDRIRYAGVEYEVDGFVQRWPSPTGVLAHTELILKRVEG
jgi:hypothetical protein